MIKRAIKKIIFKLPKSVSDSIILSIRNIKNRKYEDMSTKEMFRSIYLNNAWGNENNKDIEFYSGPGSYNESVLENYIDAVKLFFNEHMNNPNVVDLGCGDFNVGHQIRPFCSNYIACDIVDEVIEYNKKKWANIDVEFISLDAIKEPIPECDVLFVREVLQHLKNEEIQSLINNIKSRCKWLVITEAMPDTPNNFIHNIDRGVGPNTRFNVQSGVVLTSKPFNLNPIKSLCLDFSSSEEGYLRTDAYKIY